LTPSAAPFRPDFAPESLIDDPLSVGRTICFPLVAPGIRDVVRSGVT